MDRLIDIVTKIEERLRWKRDNTVLLSFYVTEQEIVKLSGIYIIKREPQDRISFKRRDGLKPFIRDNEIFVRRRNGNKKRSN